MSTKFSAREFLYADQLSKYVNDANDKHPGAISVVSVMVSTSGSLLMFSSDLVVDEAVAAIEEVHADFIDRGRGRGLEGITAEEREAETAAAKAQAEATQKMLDEQAAERARAEREAKIRAEVEAAVRARMDAEGA